MTAHGGSPLGDVDLHLFGEGRHLRLADHLGAHPGSDGTEAGVWFSVWAPAATAVAVVGDFDGWGAGRPMTPRGHSGIWETFVAGATEGQRYKFRVTGHDGVVREKADPMAQSVEQAPATASIVHHLRLAWHDAGWLEERGRADVLRSPVSIYEVHLGSWRRDPSDPGRELSYPEIADRLADYCTDMGYTHVELMPVMAHPFAGSWGYQVTSYFAPSPRWGTPEEFAALVDRLHAAGIGVLLDWVPAHFPRDEWALARFDGSALYEHLDPRRGAHPDWGTLVFNLGRREVAGFLLANALHWLRTFHLDGLRVDAVASMLYLDYSRPPGEWVPNRFGGREDLEAVEFLKAFNEVVHDEVPGVLSIAEESTAWPGVSRPTYLGGLGFGFKWNMGWMHDTLAYFGEDPVHRRYHHHLLTFAMVYAYSENFVLPISHDEVVHGKGSVLGRMPGDRWQQLANVRALYGLMWAHPGKKLLFMGCDFAQEHEWDHDRSLDWHLLDDPGHRGVQSLVRDLNHRYRERPALWRADHEPAGFSWIDADAADDNVVAFLRHDPATGAVLACVGNLSPVPRPGYRVGLPVAGDWDLVLDTDDPGYGGSGAFSGRPPVVADAEHPWQGLPASAPVDLPPLAVVWLEPAAR